MASMHVRSLAVIALGLSVAAGQVPLRAQSLAELAKKEEERRKSVPPPAKIYTNKDLTAVPEGATRAPAPSAAAPAGAAAEPAPDVAKAKDEPSAQAKDQAYWGGRHKSLQEKVDRDQTYVEAIQTRVNSLTADFVNRDDPAQRSVIERERQKATAELARLQQEIVKGKKAIADFEEEARRAGVPPGWLR
jgi:hypothetical protein